MLIHCQVICLHSILCLQPEVSSRQRALAKLALQKLIKPMVESFHEKYQNWQDSLPKLLVKNTDQTGVAASTNIENKINEEIRISTNEANDAEQNISMGKYVSDNDSNESSYFSSDSVNQFDISDIRPKKFIGVEGSASFDEINLKKPNDTNPLKKNTKIKKKEVTISKKSSVKCSTLSFKKTKSKILKKSSSAQSKGINWNIQNIAECASTSERVDHEPLDQNNDILGKKEEREENDQQKEIKNNLVQFRMNSSYSKGVNEEFTEEKFQLKSVDIEDISGKKRKKIKMSVSPVRNLDKFRAYQNQKSKDFPLNSEEDEGDNIVCNESEASQNDNPANLKTVNSEEKFEVFVSKKVEQDVPTFCKIENKSESFQIQQHEDPFFLTKDNEKYMTFGKIVAESNESLPKPKELKTSIKSWTSEKSFKNLRNGDKFQRNDDLLRRRNKRNLPLVENKIQLHPSWEARKKITTILPFEGKKISFDD